MRSRKYRQTDRRLIAEGPQALREALAAGLAEAVLATPAAAQRYPELVAGGWYELDEQQGAELADTVHSSGLLALCRWYPLTLDQWLAAEAEVLPTAGTRPQPEEPGHRLSQLPQLVVICAQIRDPGNLGTVIRCADAFGAGAVILTPGSVDPANAKTVRATAGSLFHLPVIAEADLAEATAYLRAAGYVILATAADGPYSLDELATSGYLSQPVAWIMGNEAWGLPAEDAAQADQLVRIPMWGAAESLNLAAAAAVCLYTCASSQTR